MSVSGIACGVVIRRICDSFGCTFCFSCVRLRVVFLKASALALRLVGKFKYQICGFAYTRISMQILF